MAKIPYKKHQEWFEEARPEYEELARAVGNILQLLLRKNGIDVLNVTYRAKTVESFNEKIRKKSYKDPKVEMTDMAGIRVVTMIERDIDRVAEVIKSSFFVYTDESPDKSAELGEDRFGYRSVHFVCDMGESRVCLQEFEAYEKIKFEIQVRTALQHAWAEIEHDKSYKFTDGLPSQFKRRFSRLAGLLETADSEFSRLTIDLENYVAEAHRQAEAGNLDLELNAKTAFELIKVLISQYGGRPTLNMNVQINDNLLNELRDFGITTLVQLKGILTKETLHKIHEDYKLYSEKKEISVFGILRNAMMLKNIDLYFAKAWNNHWQVMNRSSLLIMQKLHGKNKINSIIEKYDISTEGDD